MKRAFDIALASVGLALSSPLWLLIAVAIWLEDRGPVFFVQERIGRGSQPFVVYKFRSMSVADDAVVSSATHHEARITRAGRLLRKTAMDELPQLWNILRGDMSFVGPRALALYEVEMTRDGRMIRIEDVPGYHERHQVMPGLTGLAQIFACRDLRRAGKFRFDRLYVRHAGLWLDVRLVALSIWISLLGRWEVKGPKLRATRIMAPRLDARRDDRRGRPRGFVRSRPSCAPRA
jgi:lipopolysaccharide/colanic/teichoic acid biosynthesis glycosyltransferase